MKTRRSFLRKASTAGLALTALPTIPLAVANSFQDSSLSTFFGNDKLKVGLIGLGERGTTHLRNLLAHPRVEIAALCEHNPAAIRNALRLVASHEHQKPAIFFKGDDAHLELLKCADLDAVIISTPVKKHYQMTMDALEAGKHVACELVMGLSQAELQDIVRNSMRTGKQYMSLDPSFFRDDLLAVQRMIDQGLFGRIEQLKVGSYHLYQGEAQRALEVKKLKKLEGYGLGMASRLVGKNPISVSTTMVSQEEYAYPVMGKKGTQQVAFGKAPMLVSTVDFGDTQVRVQHAAQSSAAVSIGYHLSATQGAYVDVTDSIFIEDGSLDRSHKQAHPILKDYKPIGRGELLDPDACMIHGFVDALRGQMAVPVSAQEAAMSAVFPILARESRAQGGRKVKFPDFTHALKSLV